jgi:hypothetical protein
MKNKRICTSSIIFSAYITFQVFFAPQIEAQDMKGFASKGTIELGGTIAYQSISLISQGAEYQSYKVFSFLPYVGYFPTECFEIGINPLGIQTYWDSQDKITTVNILLAPAYNFKTEGNLYPFIEFQLGYNAEILSGSLADLNSTKTKRDGFSWGGRAGIKISIAGNGLLNAGLQYQQITLNKKGETERSGSDIILFSAGFTFWF